MAELKSALEAILFASGESIPAARLSLVLGRDEDEILIAARELAELYEREERGIRLLQLDDRLQLCSAPEYAPYITKTLEQRKPPQLSQSALETLAITAYFQPVTRAYIDQVRGVDSSYTVSTLLERGLIEVCGRLDVPGRPSLLRTTDVFLRTMGVSSLDELPKLPDLNSADGVQELQKKIEELQSGSSDQISLDEFKEKEGTEETSDGEG
ncbi:MAG: SMC-Scp complex subunit ScpB [Oscillospiraceae bacterium]|nr:SMC-Scp complex subunit ScpB [Oscillospiraceae bacterium]